MLVSNAPLVVAAVCRDGIVMIATHDVDSSIDIDTKDVFQKRRIDKINDGGTCLMCAGWKTDNHALATKCRSISSQEVQQYGSRNGLHLAQSSAAYMASCAVSDNVRALHCVGILGCCENDDQFALWLLDATGAYRIRAHALGGGATQSQNDKEKKSIHDGLVKTDFDPFNLQECQDALIELIQQQHDKLKKKDKQIVLEVVTVSNDEQGKPTMKRLPFQVLAT